MLPWALNQTTTAERKHLFPMAFEKPSCHPWPSLKHSTCHHMKEN